MINVSPGQYQRLEASGGGLKVRYLHHNPDKTEHTDHTFVFNCLMFMTNGGGIVRHRGMDHTVRAPFVLLARPGEHYQYGPTTNWSEVGFVFENEPSPPNLNAYPLSPWTMRAADVVAAHVALMLRLIRNLAVPGIVDQIDLLAQAALVASFRGSGEDLPPGPIQRLFALESWMRNHLASPFDLREVIRTFGFSEATFRRLWRQHFPRPPWEHVLRLRVAEACRLLDQAPDMNVSEIAYACGFTDPRYFATAFKHQMQCSPTEWRQAGRLRPLEEAGQVESRG